MGKIVLSLSIFLLFFIPRDLLSSIPSSEFDRLEALVGQGKVQEAINGYLSLLRTPDVGDSLERILYELGKLHMMIGRYEIAVSYFQQTVDRFPKGKYVGEAILGTGICYEMGKEYEKAVELYRSLISRDDIPDFQRYNAIIRASYLLLSLMAYEDAIKMVKEGMEKGIYRSSLISHLAYIYDKAGRYEEAVRVYKDMFLSSIYGSDTGWIIDGIYDFHKRKGDLEKELEEIRSEIARNPKDKGLRVLIAELYVRDGNISQAIVEYSSALRELGDDPYVLSSLSKLYLVSGELKLAEDICRRLLSLYPSEGKGKEILGEILLKKGEIVKALEIWREAFGNSFGSSRRIASILSQSGFISMAALEYEKALSHNPHDPSLLLALSKLKKQLGRYEEALDGFRKVAAIPSNPTNEDLIAEATFMLGKTLCAMGNVEEAKEELNGLVKRFPSSRWSTEAVSMLSFILSNGGYKGEPLRLFFSAQEREERGDLKGAIAGYEEIRRRFPRSPIVDDVLLAMSRAYLGMENWFQTILICDELVKRFPRSPLCPHAYMLMGEAYERMGSMAEAKMAYRRILEHYPESYLYGEARMRMDRIAEGGR